MLPPFFVFAMLFDDIAISPFLPPSLLPLPDAIAFDSRRFTPLPPRLLLSIRFQRCATARRHAPAAAAATRHADAISLFAFSPPLPPCRFTPAFSAACHYADAAYYCSLYAAFSHDAAAIHA